MDHEIEAGQKYVSPSGCIVLVEEADTDWVRYSWEEAGVKVTHTKIPSAFLIRYPDRWIEEADEPAWMAYVMSQLGMAMAYGIPFDRKEIICGASLIQERLDELGWTATQPPDPYSNEVKLKAIRFMGKVHEEIQRWFENHKSEREGYSDTHPTINPVTDHDLLPLLYTALDALVEHGDETTEPWIRKQLGVSR